MNTYSKTLDLDDYNDLSNYCLHIDNIMNVLGPSAYRLDHTHRRWEYGLAYKALDQNKSISVLDIGGGGGLLDPALMWVGMKVHIMDMEDIKFRIFLQNEKIQKIMPFEQVDFLESTSKKKFDAVVAISTIEHVEKDKEFFHKMLTIVKQNCLVVITTDFHPSGKQIVPFHLRTYNKESLLELSEIGKENGLEYFGGEPDYDHFSPEVNGCTFASLVMKRK